MASVFVLLEAFNRKEAAALGFFPCATASTADYIKMSRQIAALGNNLNQLAHIANASGKVSNTDLLTAKQIMEQIWRYIKGGGVQ